MRTDGTAATRAIARRTVSWDQATSELVVGDRRTHLACPPGDNECLLRTYLSLVAEQRNVAVDRSIVLRGDDVAVLAELLDLDDAALQSRLRRLLRLSEPAAADLHHRLLRQRLTAAAVGVGLLAAVPGSQAVASESTPVTAPTAAVVVADEPAPVPTALTIVVPEPATTAPPTTAASAPPPVAASAPTTAAPEPEPDTDVGYSVRYERDPSYVPPEGVDIGDAMFIERDPPPPGG